MEELIIALKSANTFRAEKKHEMTKIGYYSRLFQFLESRFEDGGQFNVLNYFEKYKMTAKDKDGNDKTVYGLIADNGKTYLGLNDIAFPKRLYKRTISKVDGVETTEYAQVEKRVLQGDLAVLFEAFKSKYHDALVAFDLLYLALAKNNESRFVSESFVYPTETFQRFKGEYVTSNFYLFNLKIGGTSEEKLAEIVADICEVYETTLMEPIAEAPAEEAAETAAAE
jgi:hypothetical protein